MNVYTDPKLLDVHGALDSLPSLNLDASSATQREEMRATGTDDQDAMPIRDDMSSEFAPAFAPNSGKPGQTVSFAVISSGGDDEDATQRASDETITMPSEKALPTVFASKAFEVGATRHR